jgi:hypothetical protein
VIGAAQRAAATPPRAGADPAPRWTLRRLVGWVRERFGLVCCRETIRAALHRLKLSWKKAKKLLGRADPERRQAFVERLQDVLAGAQRDQHLLVYVDEAHIHQDADLGYGWAERGQRFWVNSRSPGLSARVSFYGLYLYNEDPMGAIGSILLSGRVRVLNHPRGSDHASPLSSSSRTHCCPHRSQRDLRVPGTQPFNLGHHLPGSGRWREDVQTFGAQR